MLHCPLLGCLKYCSVNGYICVRQSQKYSHMTEDLLQGSIIKFPATGLALGHWTSTDDIVEKFQKQQKDIEAFNILEAHEMGQVEWLEEFQMKKDFMVTIDLSKRLIELSVEFRSEALIFSLFDLGMVTTDYASFRFKDVDGMMELCHHPTGDGGTSEYSLILSLKYPPKLESENLIENLFNMKRTRVLKFGKIDAEKFGHSRSLRISLSYDALQTILFHEGKEQLQNYRLLPQSSLEDSRNTTAVKVVYIGLLQDNEKVLEAFRNLHSFDARIGFCFRSLIDQSKFSWYHAYNDRVNHTGTRDPCNIFAVMQKYSPIASYQALMQIFMACGKTKFPCRLFCQLVDEDVDLQELSKHCVSIPKILLTPSREQCLGLEVEMSNRVVRKFVEEEGFAPESFLRLQLGDENGQRLFGFDISGVIKDRIETTIRNGVVINGKRYEFLAYSSSQLKEASVWMVAPTKGWTVERMRNSMGDFSVCKTASKYAARMGQCFSTTYQGVRGRDAPRSTDFTIKHVEVNDIESNYNNVLHSDGNGLISSTEMLSLLKKIPSLSLKTIQNTSIVQIRFGGAKGVLVAWEPHVLDEVQRSHTFFWTTQCSVILRKSMIKFSAPFRFLEVCRIGTTVPYYLNRNVIFLLGVHKVPNDVFLKKQKKMIDNLSLMLKSNEDAIRLVACLGGPDQRQRKRLVNILYCGLSPKTDPFLFSCCVAIRSHHLFGLRKKARIFIEKGAVLMGGMDETKLLPEFCVFLQVPKPSHKNDRGISSEDEYDIIVGPVMVTKHPAMHPGDVRMLLAIDIPQLRRHKNVLLFSQKGSRPEPNKMAGSDLDGDEYAVTWDPDLFLGEWNGVMRQSDGSFRSRNGRSISLSPDPVSIQSVNKDPLDYIPSAPAPAVDGPIGAVELVEHLINHIKNDCLGRLGMLWQDWAAEKGADCAECIELARLHSTAVDFAKTGIPAVIPKELTRNGPVAHWREKKMSTTFECKSVIGQLYDDVTLQSDPSILKNFPDGLAGRKVNKYGQILSVLSERSDSQVEKYLQKNYQAQIPVKLGWKISVGDIPEQDSMMLFANEQRSLYEFQITEIMNKYHLKNEGELFTGCIRKYHRLHKKRQHDVAEEVRRQCSEVCSEYRTYFFQHVQELTKSESVGNISSAFSTLRVNQDNEDHNDDVDNEKLLLLEMILTSNTKSYENDSYKHEVKRIARQLAAAYYISTYSPSMRDPHKGYILFSFPWLVADVIAFGLHSDCMT